MAGNDHAAAQREQFVEPGHRQVDRRRNVTRDLDENERDLLNRVMRLFERRVDRFGARNNGILETRRRTDIDIWPRSWINDDPPAVRIDSSDFSDDPATDEDPPQPEGAFANFEPPFEESTPNGLRLPDQQPASNRRVEEPLVWPPLRDRYDDDSMDRPTGESAARSQQNPASAGAEESSSEEVVAEQLDPFAQETGENPASSKSVMDPEASPLSFEDWLASNPTQHMTKRERRRNRPMRKPDNAPEEYFALNKLPFRTAPRDAAIPLCELDLDREHRVMIEEVRGPSDYTVRLADLFQTYYDFQANVECRYSAELRRKYALSNSGPLKAGRACVAMHSTTYIHPHRAVVESFDLVRRTAEVTLVDRAAREEVPIENLVQLAECMLDHPISAFRVTDPSCDIAYPPETKLSMRVKRVMSDVIEVELIPDTDRMDRKKVLQRNTQKMEGTANRQHGVPAATRHEPLARARSKSPALPNNDLRRLRLDTMEDQQRTTDRPARTFQPGIEHALRRTDRMPLAFRLEHNTEAGCVARRAETVQLGPCPETDDFRSGFAIFMGQQNNNPHKESRDVDTDRQHGATAGNRSRPRDAASARHCDPVDGRQRSLVDGRHLDREDECFPAPFGGFARDLSPRENGRRVASGYDQPSRPVRYERHRNADAHYERTEYDRQGGARHDKGPSGFRDRRHGPRLAGVDHNAGDVGGIGQGQMHQGGQRDGHRRRNDFSSQNFGGNGPLLRAVGPWTTYNQPQNPNVDERSFFYTAVLDSTNDNRPRGSGVRPPRRA